MRAEPWQNEIRVIIAATYRAADARRAASGYGRGIVFGTCVPPPKCPSLPRINSQVSLSVCLAVPHDGMLGSWMSPGYSRQRSEHGGKERARPHFCSMSLPNRVSVRR